MAPQATGMHRRARRQEPQLGQHRMEAVPFVQMKQAQGELAPRGGTEGRPVRVDPLPEPRHPRLVRRLPERAQRHVDERAGEHAAAPVLGVEPRCSRPRSAPRRSAATMPRAAHLAHLLDLPGGATQPDVHREEEHRAAVLARPGSVVVLQPREVLERAAHGPLHVARQLRSSVRPDAVVSIHRSRGRSGRAGSQERVIPDGPPGCVSRRRAPGDRRSARRRAVARFRHATAAERMRPC